MKSDKFEDLLTTELLECSTNPLRFVDSFLIDWDTGKPFKANYVQRTILSGDYKVTWFCIHRRAGKAQPVSSPVLTPKGWVPIGDLELGDYVTGPEGEAALVLKIHPHGDQDIYRIEFSDGSTAESTLDHLWQFKTNIPKKPELCQTLGTWVEMLGSESQQLKTFYLDPVNLTYYHRIPAPYLYGLYKASGNQPVLNLEDSSCVANALRESPDLIKSNPAQQLVVPTEVTTLTETQVLLSHKGNRIRVLQGILDCLGRVDKYSKNIINVKNADEGLNNFVTNLVRSLGGWAKKGSEIVEIRLPPDIKPFQILAKNFKFKPSLPMLLRRYVVKIHKVRKESARCITIGSKEHLYITENYLYTHNCIDEFSTIIDADTNERLPVGSASHVKSTYCYDLKENQVVKASCKVIRHDYQKDFLEFDFVTARPLKVSTDELIFTRKLGWIPAEFVKTGMDILAPRQIPWAGTKKTYGDVSIKSEDLLKQGYSLNLATLKLFLKDLLFEITRFLPNNAAAIIFTKTKEQAAVISDYLLAFGIFAFINDDHRLVINDIHEQVILSNIFGIPVESHESPSPRRWVKVDQIYRIGKRDCYDLEVDHPDHNFICNNVVVHNSVTLAMLALYHAVCFPGKQVWIYSGEVSQVAEVFKYIRKFLDVEPDDLVNPEDGALPSLLKRMVKSDSSGPHRIEINGSIIEGRGLGVEENNVRREGKRGSTADVVIIDEAQSLPDAVWRVVRPMISGGLYKKDVVKSFITGTIKDQASEFYQDIYIRKHAENSRVVLIPIDKNPDVTPEDIELFRSETPVLSEWHTEYLLQPAEREVNVYRHEDVEAAFKYQYEYGPHLVQPAYTRIMGVDWDKYSAGTNVCIVQWDKTTGVRQIIFRHAFDPGTRYMEACQAIVTWYLDYQVDLTLADAGAGEMQIEWLFDESLRRGINLHDRLVRVSLGSRIMVPKEETTGSVRTLLTDKPEPEYESKILKDFMVGLGAKAFQDRKVRGCSGDILMMDQFFTYRVEKYTVNTRVFTSKNEHMVDAFNFTQLGIWYIEEGGFDLTPEGISKTIEMPNQNYTDTEGYGFNNRTVDGSSFWGRGGSFGSR